MRHGKYRFLAGAMLPALALYAVFVLSPYAQAFYLSLTDWTGVSSQANFVGSRQLHPPRGATRCSWRRCATTG